jgi:hypothetical protein
VGLTRHLVTFVRLRNSLLPNILISKRHGGSNARAVNHCVRDIPELIPICFDVNCRLIGVHLLARDLLMLCQDENRNHSRKSNAAKKERSGNVKLGRQKILEGIWCLAFLINRCPQDITLSLFGIIGSRYISKSSIYSTSTSHSTICSPQFPYCCVSCASPSFPSTPSYSPRFSTTYSRLYFKALQTNPP